MLMSWGRRKGNLFEFDSIRDELRRKFESFHWSRRLLIDIGLPNLEDSPISISLLDIGHLQNRLSNNLPML
jgi:hypothetical protein